MPDPSPRALVERRAERAPLPDRLALLTAAAPAGVQPVGFLPDEFVTAWRKGNPLAQEATSRGVQLVGQASFDRIAAGD